jgi:ribosomal protein S21
MNNHEPVIAKPIEVKIYKEKDFDRAMRAFRAMVQKEKVLSLYKEKQAHETKSQKKRRKQSEAKQKRLELTYKNNSKNKKQDKEKEDR